MFFEYWAFSNPLRQPRGRSNIYDTTTENGGPVTRAKIGFQKVPGRRDENWQIRRFRRIYVKNRSFDKNHSD